MEILTQSFVFYFLVSFSFLFIKNDNLVRRLSVLFSILFSILGLLSVFLIFKNGETKVNSLIFSFWNIQYFLGSERFYNGNFLETANATLFYSSIFLTMIFLINMAVSLYSLSYMKGKDKLNSFFFFYSLLILSMVGVVLSREFLNFIFWWEIMAVSSFLLVIRDYEKEEVIKAGKIYFVANIIGSLFIISAFSILSKKGLYINTENVGFREYNLAFVLALLGFGLKSGFIPLHVWLPFAHPASPSNISAIMSGVMIKMGIYGILFFMIYFNLHRNLAGNIILILGSISAVLGVLFAIAQHNIKKLLAYHSIENIGIILIGIGLGLMFYNENRLASYLAFYGALIHTLNHSIFKSLLFLSAGYVIKKTKTDEIDKMSGIIRYLPNTSYAFLGGAISISGMPPLNGFISEFLIYLSAFIGLKYLPAQSLLAIVSLASAGGLALLCFSKVFGTMFLGNPKIKIEDGYEEKPAVYSMFFLLFLCFLIGLFSPLIFEFLSVYFKSFEARYNFSYIKSILWGISSFYLIFLSLFFSFLAFKRYIYSGKKILKTPTWDCGYEIPQGLQRFQYTASSFAQSVTDLFSKILIIKTDYYSDGKFIISKARFETHPQPVFFRAFYLPFSEKIQSISKKYSAIQGGNMRIYILYILLSLIFLILWKL